jgi:hypothetical protein
MSWWKRVWEWLGGTEQRPARLASEEPAPAPVALWIEPLEERVIVGIFWAR